MTGKQQVTSYTGIHNIIPASFFLHTKEWSFLHNWFLLCVKQLKWEYCIAYRDITSGANQVKATRIFAEQDRDLFGIKTGKFLFFLI